MIGSLVAIALLAAAAPEEVILSLSSGASRGAHQAGVLYALTGAARAGAGPRIGGISGSALGSLNALLAALAHCSVKHPEPLESPLWQAWRALSWEGLFPGSASCKEYAELNPELQLHCAREGPWRQGDGLLSSNGVRRVRKIVLHESTIWQKRGVDCRVPLAISLTSEKPLQLPITPDYKVPSSRRALLAELRVAANGATPLLYQPEPPANPSTFNDAQFIELPVQVTSNEEGEDEISFGSLLDAITASSSTPPLFVSPPLLHCATECDPIDVPGLACSGGKHLCRSRFEDGGVFDARPLSTALALAQAVEHGGPSHFLLLDSDIEAMGDNRFTRTRAPPTETARLRGTRFYLDAIRKFIGVSADYELQTLVRYKLLDVEGKGETTASDGVPIPKARPLERRPLSLAGDQLWGYAGFIDPRFAELDYLVGIYEGVFWLTARGCPECKPEQVAQLFYSQHRGVLVEGDAHDIHGLPLNGVESRFVILRALQAEFCGQSPQPFCAETAAALSRLEKGNAQAVAPLAALTDALDWGEDPRLMDRGMYAYQEVARQLRIAGTFKAVRPVTESSTWFWEQVRDGFSRLEETERAEGNPVARIFAAGSYLGAFRAAGGLPGLNWSPSTIAESATSGFGAIVQKAIPYSLTADVLSGHMRVGWEIGRYQSFPWRLDLGAGLDYGTVFVPDDLQFRTRGLFGPTAAISVLTSNSVLIAQAGLRVGFHPLSLGPGFSQMNEGYADSIGAEVFARPLFGRLEVAAGVRSLPALWRSDREQRASLFLSVGFADINGMVFWIAHLISGNDELYNSILGTAEGKALP